MNPFERHLIDNGMHFQVAGSYGRKVEEYINWVKAQGLTVANIKRSDYTNYEEHCRTVLKNKQRTINGKNTAIKRYYQYKRYANNPAYSPYRRPREMTLPCNLLTPKQMNTIYEELPTKTLVQKRDKSIMGMILYQGLTRSEVAELRPSDIDFDKTEIYIVAQRKTNARRLPLESKQILDLHRYLTEIRPVLQQLKINKTITDQLFISMGTSTNLDNALNMLLNKLRRQFPIIINLIQLRQSVITKWEKEEGILEAKVKAGHRYISSTERYQTTKLEELKDELAMKHPMEKMKI